MSKSEVHYGFSKRVRELRKNYNLTQVELADALKISYSFMGLVERGERLLSIEKLLSLCSYFGVSLDYLILGKQEGNKHDFNTLFNDVLNEDESVFLSKVAKEIIPSKCNSKDYEYLLKSINLYITYSRKNKV